MQSSRIISKSCQSSAYVATNQYIHSLGTYQPLSHQQLQGLPQPHTLILLVEYHSGQHTHELYQHPQIQYTQMC